MRYMGGRLLELIPLMLGVSFIIYLILALAPGDPIRAMLANAPQSSAARLEALRHSYGLDQPIPVRYLKWLGHAVRGDLGWSMQDQTPVLELIQQRFPNSLLLMGTGLVLATAVAVPVGIYSALRPYSLLDYLASSFSFIGFSTPIFWMALALIYMFSVQMRILPAGGLQSAGGLPGWAGVADRFYHLVLPVAVISLYNMATLVRYTRSAMLEVIRQDYVRTARAKGVPERNVVGRHALRNALIPVITILALTLPALFGGAPVTETVFSWPGIGHLLIHSVLSGDLIVAQGVLFVLSFLVLVLNLLADLAYALVDPRVRYG
jgi:peptide/nickel transport system permease protein